MKKAAMYMRVSTARQEEDQTIKSQEMELVRRIKEAGNVLLPECVYKDDGWSGAIIERPDLDRMRSDAREHKFEILYTYDRGRISRKFVHQEIVLDELRTFGIEYVSLHDINGKSTEETLMGSVMGIFHEYERVKIAERMRLGKARKVRENKKLLGYQPKYGYDYHRRIKAGPEARDGFFTINQAQAAVVKMIYGWVADGASKHEVRKRLFKQGVPPPRGMRDQWGASTIDRLLRDTTYMGDHFYNKSESVPTKNPQNPDQKYRKVVKGSRIVRPKEDWCLIKVPAIVSAELFHAVQVKLALNKRLNTRNNFKNEYLVKGLIECPCGKARTGDPANGSLYYRCTDRLSKFPEPRTCHEPGINATVLDDLVWRNVKELLLQPDLVAYQAQRWQKEASPHKKQLSELESTLKGLDDEERRYAKAYGKAVMSERMYKENMHEVNAKRESIMSEASGLRDTIMNKPTLPLEKLVDGVVKLVASLDFTDKNLIIRKLVTKIVATKKEVTIWGQIPLLGTGQVGYESEHWNRGAAECR